jgi:hypothetical protein
VDRSYELIYDLGHDELFELAYYFQHDYADGRDPESYVTEAYAAFRRWQADADCRGLVYRDLGDALAIWDFRAGATKTLTILRGIERTLYLYCDQNRSWQQIVHRLAAEGADPSDIAATLDRLGECRLMIEADGRFLSLATLEEPEAAERSQKRAARERHLVF